MFSGPRVLPGRCLDKPDVARLVERDRDGSRCLLVVLRCLPSAAGASSNASRVSDKHALASRRTLAACGRCIDPACVNPEREASRTGTSEDCPASDFWTCCGGHLSDLRLAALSNRLVLASDHDLRPFCTWTGCAHLPCTAGPSPAHLSRAGSPAAASHHPAQRACRAAAAGSAGDCNPGAGGRRARRGALGCTATGCSDRTVTLAAATAAAAAAAAAATTISQQQQCSRGAGTGCRAPSTNKRLVCPGRRVPDPSPAGNAGSGALALLAGPWRQVSPAFLGALSAWLLVAIVGWSKTHDSRGWPRALAATRGIALLLL